MEIDNKFRIWNDRDKKWELGYDLLNLGGFSMIGEVMLFGEYHKLINSFSLEDLHYLKIMRWTGLEDKNRKEIYDKDILRVIFYHGKEKHWFTDAYYLVDASITDGVSLRFLKLVWEDGAKNQVPYYQQLEMGDELEDNNGKLQIRYQHDDYEPTILNPSENIEVIGNIYENPELLNNNL